MEDEPPEAFFIFSKFYLTAGPTRTLLKTYITYLSIEDPERLKGLSETSRQSAPTEWTKMVDAWEWRERALAYDEKFFTNQGAVELARQALQRSSMDAVEALQKALQDRKTRVSAAKEILDRAGIPSSQKLVVSTTPFSADEYAEAQKEIDEWEKKPKKIETELNG